MNMFSFVSVKKVCCATLALLIIFSVTGQTASTDPFGINQTVNMAVDPLANTAPASAMPAINAPAAPVVASPSSAVPAITTNTPQFFDYSVNLKSDVFGANLFTGAFAREGATSFNPDYVVANGDNIQVRFWGAFDYDAPLTVDPQGNIFVPHV